MDKKSSLGSIAKAWRDADDIVRQVTGRRLGEIVGKAFDLYGDEIMEKVGAKAEAESGDTLDFNDPYFILGVRKNALDIVVKGAYRSLAREYHTDTGKNPDPNMFQKVTEAYKKIMAERDDAKKGG